LTRYIERATLGQSEIVSLIIPASRDKMSDFKKFEEEEEALFADDNTTGNAPPKGLRLVPYRKMSDFIAWLRDAHPEIQGVYHLNYQNIGPLVKSFERLSGSRSDYTAEEWLRSLQQW
jgi:hypothetical protein